MALYVEVRMGDIPYRNGPGLLAILLVVVLMILAVIAAWGTGLGGFSNWM